MDPTCSKSFARKKHFSGFYLKWRLFPRVTSTAEIQAPAQVSTLKTGLWAPLKYCDCTCHRGRQRSGPGTQKLVSLLWNPGAFETEGLQPGEKKQSSPLSLQPPTSSLCQLLFEIIRLSLGSLSFYFNWGWQVRHKVKELEITCTTKTTEPERQPFS